MHDHEGRPASAGIRRRTLLELGAAAAVAPAVSALMGGAASADDDNDEKTRSSSRFTVDPFWPKPLPDKWITGEVAGSAIDARDHLWTVNRRNLTDTEQRMVRENAANPSPAIIEFDQAGSVVNSWTAPVMPDGLHGIFIDHHGYVWIAGNGDGIVQKYDRDGNLKLQIGTKGVRDTTNHSTTLLNRPSDIAIDPTNDEIYISDGYGNRRLVVFDRNGSYLRQWGEQGTNAEAEAGTPYRFREVVHAVNLGADGLVYVNDRKGDRIHVYTKGHGTVPGDFVKNIWINKGVGWRMDPVHVAAGNGPAIGSAWDAAFSTDKDQTFIYNTDGEEQINWTVPRTSDHPIARYGRGGHQAGDFTYNHTITVDSKGNVYVAETVRGRRLQKFKPEGRDQG